MGQPSPDRIRHYLQDAEYPCDRVELVRYAAARGADEDLLGHLGSLPEQQRFNGLDSVHEALHGRA